MEKFVTPKYSLRKFSVVISLLTFCLPPGSVAAEPQSLHITTGFTPPVSDYFRAVLKNLDKRLPGISIDFEELAAERSLDLVNRGINDAECCRIPKAVTDHYPHLIPLHNSFHTVRFVAFSKRQDLPITRFEDLKPYAVGTVQGWRLAVREIKRIAPREQYILNTPEQLMEMLKKDRIEIAVMGLLSGLKALHQAGLEGVHTYRHPPLAELPLVLMLNDRHQQLAAPIDETIQAMKADGTIKHLKEAILHGR